LKPGSSYTRMSLPLRPTASGAKSIPAWPATFPPTSLEISRGMSFQ